MKLKNLTIIFLVILLLAVGGYTVYKKTKGKSVPVSGTPSMPNPLPGVDSEIYRTVRHARQKADMQKFAIKEETLSWNHKKESEPMLKVATLDGYGFKARTIPRENAEKIENYLKEQGFEENKYNISRKNVTSLVGYEKEDLVCTVFIGLDGGEAATQKAGDFKYNAELVCAKRN